MAKKKVLQEIKPISRVYFFTIPAAKFDYAYHKAAAERCVRGNHHFARPHRMNMGGGPCRCSRKCVHCRISEEDFRAQQKKR